MSDDLHVWWTSGELVATTSRQELPDVISLKKHLHWLTGYPRFWQRLLHGGAVLEDEEWLGKVVDVQLVVLHDFVHVSEEETFELAIASDRGRVQEVEAMLQRPLDPDTGFWAMGVTPLHFACRRGYGAIVGMLLEAEAEVNKIDMRGATALHLAAKRGHSHIATLLLEASADADLNIDDGLARTALHWASALGRLDVVEVLLRSRATTDLPDKASGSLLALNKSCRAQCKADYPAPIPTWALNPKP